jgi:hypothetical protein
MHESIGSELKSGAFVVFAGEPGWKEGSVYVGSNVIAGSPEPLEPSQARAMAEALLRAADSAESARTA